jgi:hypothetical protein
MQPDLFSRSCRLAVALVVGVVVWCGLGASATAGGWAVASLDSVPTAEPGRTVQVGFTVLQHGVTPVALDEDVGIELTLDGTSEYFPATADGAVGHYVAEVTFPAAAGEYDWSVQMGWFGPYELGSIEVTAGDPEGASIWAVGRWVLLATAVGLGAIAVSPLLARRPRPAMQ